MHGSLDERANDKGAISRYFSDTSANASGSIPYLICVLVANKSTNHGKPLLDLFFNTISTSKECSFFFRARAEKGIARHIDASSVVWTVIDNCKLANQIVRLAAIVVKYSVPELYFAVTISNV